MEVIRGEDVFILKNKLGKGFFGDVHLTSFRDKDVAIKIQKITDNQRREESYINETEVHSILDNANVIKLLGFFNGENNHYILLEYCNCGDLGNFVKKETTSMGQLKGFVLQTISGLEYLHSHLVLHGDIKPDNIFVHNFSLIKIGDFGFSHKFTDKNDRITRRRGTPRYMAPEIIQRESYSLSPDIWALGVMIHYLFAEKFPFKESNDDGKLDLKLLYTSIASLEYELIDEALGDEMADILRQIFILNSEDRPGLEEISEAVFKM